MAALRQRGRRTTNQRLRILTELDGAPDGLSAEEFVACLGLGHGEPGRSTAYRTLSLLARIGAVDIVHPKLERHRYVPRRTSHQHHIVCDTGGRIAVFEGCRFDEIASRVAGQTGYSVLGHSLELSGRWAECRVARAEAGLSGIEGGPRRRISGSPGG